MGKNYKKLINDYTSWCRDFIVASWLIASGYEWLWRLLSTITALAATIYPFLRWNEKINAITTLRTNWIKIYHNLDSLWIEYAENPDKKGLRNKLIASKNEIADAQIEESVLSKDNQLRNLCYNEVMESKIRRYTIES